MTAGCPVCGASGSTCIRVPVTGGGEPVARHVLRLELAEHGDGARAMTAAEVSGLARRELEAILHELVSGKRGATPARVRWAPRPWRRAHQPRLCPVCHRYVNYWDTHMRRQHPEAVAK